MLAFTARTLFTPIENIDRPLLLVEGESIVGVGPLAATEIPPNTTVVNFEDCSLAPGLVDIHTHGAVGHDVMQADDDGRRRMEQFLSHHGVTSYYPTTVTAPLATIQSALERLANAVAKVAEDGAGSSGRARPLGNHSEGPF